jgi:hypothetical protein
VCLLHSLAFFCCSFGPSLLTNWKFQGAMCSSTHLVFQLLRNLKQEDHLSLRGQRQSQPGQHSETLPQNKVKI